jgi:hypothetical protein
MLKLAEIIICHEGGALRRQIRHDMRAHTIGVKPRTGPLQTNKPVTAPATTHHGLVNFTAMASPPWSDGVRRLV